MAPTLAVVSSLVLGLSVARSRAEPTRAAWSEVVSDSVAQVIVCNFDSVSRVELFAHARAGALIHLNIREYPDGPRVASSGQRASGNLKWIPFDAFTYYRAFVRGRQYEFRFTWSGADPMRYYFSPDTHDLEHAIVGGVVRDSWDLAMRVHGLTKPVDETYFGAYPYFPMGGETWGCAKSTWKEKAREAGLHHARFRIAWTWVDSVRYGAWRYSMLDTQYRYLRDSLGGCEVHANLHSSTPTASTHYDGTTASWSVDAPPCSLFLPVSSPNNRWARFVEKTVRHYDSLSYRMRCDSISTWEIWNEPNVLKDYWLSPNARDYGRLASVRARCSIYVRLCEVAHSVITDLGGHRHDRILVGSIGDVESEEFSEKGDTLILKGKVWLRWIYDIALKRGGPGLFWDGVAFHYYRRFDPDSFEADAETLRTIMRNEHKDFGQLWVTEVGWPAPGMLTEEVQANVLTEVFATALSSVTRPGGGYDRIDWFCFRDAPVFNHGLADTLMRDLKPSFHSFAQVGKALAGKRPNGRTVAGDTAADSLMYVHEYEDTTAQPKRMWVAWRNARRSTYPPARIPVLTNAVRAESLAYRAGAPPEFQVSPGLDGWLRLTLSERPVFVTEVGPRSRPDLVVDSVRVEPEEPTVGQRMVIRAWVRNRADKETRATPKGMATKVLFMWEGDTLGYETTAQQMGVGKTVEVRFPVVEVGPEMAGPALVRVVANPEQRYVELDMDNNDGYAHAEVRQ